MKHPDAQSRVQAELDAANAAGSLSSPIKYTEATKLPYLCACIKEAMRLHPSVGLTMARHAPAGGIELSGKFIPKNYRIGVNPAIVQTDKEVFGTDAAEFKPDRWLVTEEQFKVLEKNMLLFGAGTRTCIGKNVCSFSPSLLWNCYNLNECRTNTLIDIAY